MKLFFKNPQKCSLRGYEIKELKHSVVNSVYRNQRKDCCESEATFGFIMSSRPASATY